MFRREQYLIRKRNFRPLRIESLEDRVVPAYDLLISGLDATLNMGKQTVSGVTTFSPSASSAVLQVSDIYAELAAGNDVVINTGSSGTEAGDITWGTGPLDFNGIVGTRVLRLVAKNTMTLGVPLGDSDLNSRDHLDLILSASSGLTIDGTLRDLDDVVAETTAKGAAISLHDVSGITGNFTMTSTNLSLLGNVNLLGGTLTLNGATSLDAGSMNVSINTRRSDTFLGAVTFNGTINSSTELGTAGLNLVSGIARFGGAIGFSQPIRFLDVTGSIAILSNVPSITTETYVSFDGNVTTNSDLSISIDVVNYQITFKGGTADFGARNVDAGQAKVLVQGGASNATLAMSGTLTVGELILQSGADLSPGGSSGSFSTFNIVGTSEPLDSGKITFMPGSRLLLDAGSAGTDRVIASGAVEISENTVFLEIKGTPPGPVSQTLLQGSVLSGQFQNYFNGGQFVVGNDAFRFNYGENNLQITQIEAGASTVVGALSNGSVYTVKLTGPTTGKLVVLNQGDGIDVVVRNSTLSHALSITVNPNGGSERLIVGQLRVNGAIGAITAPTIDLIGSANITGVLKSLTIGTTSYAGLTAAGTASDLTTLVKGESLYNISLGSRITTLDVSGNLGGVVGASSITTLKVGGNLSGTLILTPTSDSATALSTATIGSMSGSIWDIRGKIGTVSVAGGLYNATIGTSDSVAINTNKLGDISSFKVSGVANSLIINSVGRITTLTAGGFTSSLDLPTTVKAKTIGTLSTVANPANGSTGAVDNGFSLTLDAGSRTNLALSTASFAGTFNGNFYLYDPITGGGTSTPTTWDIRGKIGSFTVKGNWSNFTLGNTATAGQFPNQLGDITTVSTTGTLYAVNLNSVGRITTLNIGGVGDGNGYSDSATVVRAGSIGTFSSVANTTTAATGAVVGLRLILDAGSSSALALGSATIAGVVVGNYTSPTEFSIISTPWDIRGKIGNLTAQKGLFSQQIGTTTGSGEYPNQLGDIAGLTVAGGISQLSINSAGRITALTADRVDSLNLRAVSLGTMTVGTAAKPGWFRNSSVILTGSFGTSQTGLGTVTIAGTVDASTFNVQAGNVTSFTVGRFQGSRLYVGYTPTSNFTVAGTFNGAYTLSSFKTTQVYTGGLAQTLAYRGSEVVANKFGTVLLTGVQTDNNGTAFGLRVNGAGNRGSVRVNAPTPTFSSSIDLLTGFTAGDFRFIG